MNDIDHTRTKAQSPQTNGICERFHKTVLNEFYQVAFRKKIYTTLEELHTEPHRLSRRLHTLRGWSHESNIEAIFSRS